MESTSGLSRNNGRMSEAKLRAITELESIILPENETLRPTGMIRHISAVTFAVGDMARSVEFYRKLGFELLCGGECATFSSLRAGEAFVNLVASQRYEQRWWGRAIFRVDQVDVHYR